MNEYSINQVVIYNRLDCCSKRLIGSKVYVTNNAQPAKSGKMSSDELCGTVSSLPTPRKVTLTCNGRQGKYVIITKNDATALTLCEVQVFGTKVKCKYHQLN